MRHRTFYKQVVQSTNPHNFQICCGLKVALKSNGKMLKVFLYLFLINRFVKTQIPIRDTNVFKEEYDFVIIGAGSAGCVIANRLSEVSKWTTLLLEAGKEENYITDIPLTAFDLAGTSYDWGYVSEPQKGACLAQKDGRCPFTRGKALGGTSVINAMMYTRGHRHDYDHWRDLGNTGWGYDDVLKYFKKSEDNGIAALRGSPYHSEGGYLSVQQAPFMTVIGKTFLESGTELGYQLNDTNGPQQEGYQLLAATIRGGKRCSTSKAFLQPVQGRNHLWISRDSFVTKILIDDKTKTASGVEFTKNNATYVVRVRKEVILSAGTIASPQLLMVSGVGPKEHLESLNITVIKDLEVGSNLQDHMCYGGLLIYVNVSQPYMPDKMKNPAYMTEYASLSKGPYTVPVGVEALAFEKSKYELNKENGVPDIELITISPPLPVFVASKTPDGFEKFANKNMFTIVPVGLHPKSVGRISLRSKDPATHPIIDPKLLTEDQDFDVLVEGVRLAIRTINSKAFQKLNATLDKTPSPQCEDNAYDSDDYWRCVLRYYATTLYHPVGTCKMGPASDPDAVVGPDLLVHGIKHLRVADASIMPKIPGCHTNAVAIMIGEKASDLVKERWVERKKKTRKHSQNNGSKYCRKYNSEKKTRSCNGNSKEMSWVWNPL